MRINDKYEEQKKKKKKNKSKLNADKKMYIKTTYLLLIVRSGRF